MKLNKRIINTKSVILNSDEISQSLNRNWIFVAIRLLLGEIKETVESIDTLWKTTKQNITNVKMRNFERQELFL